MVCPVERKKRFVATGTKQSQKITRRSEKMKNRRVFLKLSGEPLQVRKRLALTKNTVKEVARQVKASVDAGVQVGVVIGGGHSKIGQGASGTMAADVEGQASIQMTGGTVHGVIGGVLATPMTRRGNLFPHPLSVHPQFPSRETYGRSHNVSCGWRRGQYFSGSRWRRRILE